MSDASSSTPFLTPQSTGTQDSSSPASSGKSHPQAAFYPNVNAVNKEQKPFSRSAAKRGSVMALGSIEHLQHYFTKTGLITKKEYVTLSLSLPSRSHIIGITAIQDQAEKEPCSCKWILQRHPHQRDPLVK
jgi:hypothetical protein